MANVNDNYFDGLYKEIWRQIIPEILTQRETDFILAFFNLRPGMKVLDLMCGYGRHALALGRKGIEVTAVDNLPVYVQEIEEISKREGLPVEAFVADVRSFISPKQYHLVICMGNSLNFYDADETLQILKHISESLLPGEHLLINTWSLLEIVLPVFKEESRTTIGDVECITQSKLLEKPARMESVSRFIKDGITEEKKAVDYLYSLEEMKTMLEKSGLIFIEAYSVPGKKNFTEGEPRAYIIARKAK